MSAENNTDGYKDFIQSEFEKQKVFLSEELDKLTQQLNSLKNSIEENKKQKKSPSKNTTPKTPQERTSPEVAFKKWKQGFEDPSCFELACHYIPKNGEHKFKTCNCKAAYMLVGNPSKRTPQLIPKENPLKFIIDEYGPNPEASFPYIRCNSHKNQALKDDISQAVLFTGTLDNGAVVHADETEPSEEKIAASLSEKPTSPARNKSPVEIQEEVSLPVVEDNQNEEDNDAELELLINGLDN